jgi:hypothetical protein
MSAQLQIILTAVQIPATLPANGAPALPPRMGLDMKVAWVLDGSPMPCNDHAAIMRVLETALDYVKSEVPFNPPRVLTGVNLAPMPPGDRPQ